MKPRNFESYVYEPIDLCACYEPMFEAPQELIEKWNSYCGCFKNVASFQYETTRAYNTHAGAIDFVPFKNLINEFMAKDTSRKSKAAFRAKFLNGERVNSMAPFGYVKHPDILGHELVYEIFERHKVGQAPVGILVVVDGDIADFQLRTFGDSVSIETQRTVLTQFVMEHPEFYVVSKFSCSSST